MEALAALPDDAPLLDKILIRHRRTVGNIKLWLLHDEAIFIESGILIPLVIVETLWWCQAFQHNYFALFPDKYLLSITMVITSLYGFHIIFIWQGFWSAGGWDDQWRWRSCCLSGEFQSFLIQSQLSQPLQVMTLALGIAPTVARDFSVMIQSVGIIMMWANPNSIWCPK